MVEPGSVVVENGLNKNNKWGLSIQGFDFIKLSKINQSNEIDNKEDQTSK